MRRFEGNVALVTGGRGGIGRAVAERLRDEGARVRTAQRLAAPGFETVEADLGDAEAPAKVVKEAGLFNAVCLAWSGPMRSRRCLK